MTNGQKENEYSYSNLHTAESKGIGIAMQQRMGPNGTTVYSSGIHIDGTNKDLSYVLTSLDGSPASNDVFMAGATYLSANTTNSAWISPFAPDQHVDDITLSVGTTLDLTGMDLTNNMFSSSSCGETVGP